MMQRSLARRMISVVLLAEFLCAVAFSVTALWHERRTRVHAFDVMLQGRSDSLLGAVHDTEDAADSVAIDPAELKVPASDVYALYGEDGRLLSVSRGAPPALIARRSAGMTNAVVQGKRYRVLQRNGLRIVDRDETGGAGIRRPVVLVYAARTRGIWHEILEAAGFYMIVSAALLLATAGLLIVFLRRALLPLDELAERAANVSKASLSFEPPASALHVRELTPLANALSRTVDRLRLAFESEARFVSDAAHELKTAVAVERSSLQVLMMRERSREELASAMSGILDDNKRVEDLVSRMLMLARMEEGTEPVVAPADLGALVRATLGRLQSLAQIHEVDVRPELEEGLQVLVSAEQVETLVSNLVVNAMQYSQPQAEIIVQVARVDAEAVLVVADRGVGISAEALPHVFERFYREDRSRSRETGGAGLGLAICKSIVEATGGSIEMESREGEGTTVRVAFMLA